MPQVYGALLLICPHVHKDVDVLCPCYAPSQGTEGEQKGDNSMH